MLNVWKNRKTICISNRRKENTVHAKLHQNKTVTDASRGTVASTGIKYYRLKDMYQIVAY